MSSSRKKKSSGNGRASSTPAGSGGGEAKKKVSSGFILDMRYWNDLPTPPVDPKFIKIPWNADKLYKYHISSLEQHYKYRVHIEPSMGPVVNLIDPTTAEVSGVTLSEADRRLIRRENDELQEFYQHGEGSGKTAVSAFGNTMSLRNLYESAKVRDGKHWLRKTEYMDNSTFGKSRGAASGAAEAQRKLAELEKERRIMAGNAARKTKSERIEASFEACTKVPQHKADKSLKPVKIFPIMPALDLVANQVFHVHFMDENILDDGKAQLSSDKKSKKRGRTAAEYTPKQIAQLEAGILEQLHEDEENTQISFLVPTVEGVTTSGNPDKEDDPEKEKTSDSEEGPSKRQKTSLSSSSSPSNLEEEEFAFSDQRPGSTRLLKWLRDYEYQTQAFRPCERFAFVWDKSALEAPVDSSDVLYSKVRFVDLVESRLEMRRSKTDKFDAKASRKKRIPLERRPYSEQEKQEQRERRREYEEGYLIGFEEADEDQDESDNDEKPAATPKKKSVNFKADSDSPSDSDSSDEDNEEDEKKASKEKNSDKKATKADASDSDSGSDSESD